MTRREKLFDDYENALFAFLMEDVAEEQGRQALADNERLRDAPEAAMPELLRRRCEHTIRHGVAVERRRAAGRVAFRLVSRVAVVVMVLVLSLTVAFAASPSMQTTVAQWVVDHYGDRIEKPFAITAQPEDVTTPVGGTATFSVSADGRDLTYLWQVKVPGGSWTDMGTGGPNMSILHITAAAADHGCRFRCIVTAPDGARLVSGTAELAVTAVITGQPQGVTAPAGETASFTVIADGPGLTYQWQICTPGGRWEDCNLTGYGTPTLTVAASGSRDGEQYRCVVTDAGGNQLVSDPAALKLERPPEPTPEPTPEQTPEPNEAMKWTTITRQPESASAEPYDKVVFSVEAQGEGLIYIWQVSSDGGKEWWEPVIEGISYNGLRTPQLTVEVDPEYHGRLYRCMIADTNLRATYSQPAKLTVLTKIIKQPRDAFGRVGDTAHFRVEVEGPGLTYQWQFKPGDKASWIDTTLEGAKKDELSVPVTEERDGNQYRCVIHDANGATLTTDAAALTVTPYVAQGCCGDDLNWTLSEDGTLTISGTGAMWSPAELADNAKDEEINDEWDYRRWAKKVKKVVIGPGVTRVSVYAFTEFECLQELDLSNGLETIEKQAFYFCESLKRVVLPDSVKRIGDNAFGLCTGLQEVVFGRGIEHIENNGFSGCFSLTSITFQGERIPQFGPEGGQNSWTFSNVTATVYYPDAGDWAEKTPGELEKMFRKHHGNMTCVPYTP